MADGEDLGEKLSGIVRASAGRQAKAHREYGVLLERLSSRDIKPADFAREAVDLYLNALGKLASAGVTLANEALEATLRGVKAAASDRAAATDAPDKAQVREAQGTTAKPTSRKASPTPSPTT